MNNALQTILGRLDELEGIPRPAVYNIPSLWLHPAKPGAKRVVPVDPVAFYRGQINFQTAAQQQGVLTDARFLKDNGYQGVRSIRFGVKLSF